MFKVKIEFQSNIKGVYTKEEETATDKNSAEFKLQRMVNRWFNILCPHIDFDKLPLYNENKTNITHSLNLNDKQTIQLILINRTLETLDKIDNLFNNYSDKDNIQERKFLLWMTEVKETN